MPDFLLGFSVDFMRSALRRTSDKLTKCNQNGCIEYVMHVRTKPRARTWGWLPLAARSVRQGLRVLRGKAGLRASSSGKWLTAYIYLPPWYLSPSCCISRIHACVTSDANFVHIEPFSSFRSLKVRVKARRQNSKSRESITQLDI